ncbi:hypothetical protein FCV25MIE_29221 [Fagus crenata]|jgi:hypothetical protein
MALLKKAISSFSYISTATNPLPEASASTINNFEKFDRVKTGACIMVDMRRWEGLVCLFSPLESFLFQQLGKWCCNRAIIPNEFLVIPSQSEKTMECRGSSWSGPRSHAIEFFRGQPPPLWCAWWSLWL